MTTAPQLNYKKKDFISDQEVRWCPGCGDYAILSAVQTALTKINRKKEEICFISGIGCSSRFPYYVDTYGLHGIHGRACSIASGLKTHRPELSVWVITGDGDGLSIGGNHLIHTIRRNLNLNILIFNNQIYGLTKGQYSPTSERGTVTKSTPYGSVDRPFRPASLALGAEATFFARTIDTDPKHMIDIFIAAEKHQGTSVVEIMQNCVIFNDSCHDPYTNKATRDEFTIRLEHGRPMRFGKNLERGIKLNGLRPEIVEVGAAVTEEQLLFHDAHSEDVTLANFLARFSYPEQPVPLGVFRSVQAPIFEDDLHEQIRKVTEQEGGRESMLQVIHGEGTWEIS